LASALVQRNVRPNHALVTPAKQDEVTKTRTKLIKQVDVATKRKTAVAASQVTNGSGALAAELQNDKENTARPVNATLAPAAAKKKKKSVEPAKPAAAPVVTGPPVPKCEGCIHCDLLELKVMEPKVIRHCLKPNQFLELAKCAGGCGQSIKSIHATSPKANVRCCDINKKGFDAPEDDPSKESMECSLVLCVPCCGVREAKHDAVNERGSRRRGQQMTKSRKQHVCDQRLFQERALLAGHENGKMIARNEISCVQISARLVRPGLH
jgi:hypothetical protein